MWLYEFIRKIWFRDNSHARHFPYPTFSINDFSNTGLFPYRAFPNRPFPCFWHTQFSHIQTFSIPRLYPYRLFSVTQMSYARLSHHPTTGMENVRHGNSQSMEGVNMGIVGYEKSQVWEKYGIRKIGVWEKSGWEKSSVEKSVMGKVWYSAVSNRRDLYQFFGISPTPWALWTPDTRLLICGKSPNPHSTYVCISTFYAIFLDFN